MTLSKNTAKVRECKRRLVKSFRNAKDLLDEKQQPPQNRIPDIQVLRGILDAIENNTIVVQQNSKSIVSLENKISTLEFEKKELEYKLEQKAKEDKEVIESIEMLAEANSFELERFTNGHCYWMSVVAYAVKHQLGSFSERQASAVGRKATTLCTRVSTRPTLWLCEYIP